MARKIVFAWGRFNPPTTGHKVVMDRVAKEAKSRKAEYAIFASKSNDPKKNPLTFRTKVKFLKQSFPKHAKNINASPRLKTVLDVMKSLDKKYQEVSLVVGADRAQEFKKLLNHYNGREYDFEEIEIISAGERDPDAEDVTGMSASKMRKFAVDGNYKEFKKGSPMKNPKELYNAIRRGMKINEEFYGMMNELHDITDKSIVGRRFNTMLRFGLVKTRDIPITQRAFKDMEKSGSNQELRKHIFDVSDKTLEYVMADDLLYRRFLLLLHDDFLMKEEHRDALLKKAEKSQLSYTSLLEVFLRGLAASPIYGDKTAHQHAFDRVNSYVAGGHSRKTLDADIWESTQQKNTGRTPMKRLRDVKPPEWGTKEMADRYSKVVPGQPDDIGESAPPGAEAEAFIKDNKGKFKERYGDKWEQVLYATAWKVYGKNESVDEASPYKNPNKDGMISKSSEQSAARAAKARRNIRTKLANRKKIDAARARGMKRGFEKAAQKADEEFEIDEARSAGYKMPQSKDPYTVKYAASKRGKIQVTVVDGEKAAKKFLADVKKKGMNGIITKGGHQKEEVEEAYKTPAEKKAERLAKIARASAAREKDQAKEKEKATAKHNKASAKSREAIKYRGDKDQFGRPRHRTSRDTIGRRGSFWAREKAESVELEIDEAKRLSPDVIKKMKEVLVLTAKGDMDRAMKINATLPPDAKKVLTKVKNNQQLSKHLKTNEEVEIDEAKMGAIARKIKAGPSPYTIVAMVGKKVVDQDYAKVADQVPAIVRELKKENPKAKIGVEDRTGKMLHTEDIEVVEGGMGMIGRTKPSRELNISREEKPYLAGKSSLKDKKRDAHKAERAKAKKQLKRFKKY